MSNPLGSHSSGFTEAVAPSAAALNFNPSISL
jgi:hypothetical protein